MTRTSFTRPVMARACATAALGGVAIGMGGAPYQAYAIAWAGPALIVLALRALRDAASGDERKSLRRAALVGLSAGLASNATTCAWVVDLLRTYAYMPAPIAWLVASLLFLAQSLPFVLASMLAWALDRLTRELVGPRPPTIELSFVVATVLASSASPMIFPWRIANSQTGLLPLAQIVELGGLPLLDLVLGLASVVALLALRGRLSVRERVALGLAAVALIAAPTAWGVHRLEEVRAERETLPPLVVGLVQHDFDVPERFDASQWESQIAITWSLSHALDREGVDVLLWPESSYPWGLRREALGLGGSRGYPSEIGVALEGVHAPVVLGAMTRDATDVFNSVIAIDGARVLGIVDKTRLMPFSERIPLWELVPFLHGVLRPGLTPGPRDGGALEVAGQRLGILNCYEDLMPEHVWRVMGHAPTVLSNHTNDAWFGRTRAPELHHFLARMRAIETRRDLVRTVNTGVSGVVASTGETLVRTEVFERTAVRATVRPSRALTPWVRYGDVTTAGLWGAVLALLARWLRRRAASE